MSTYNTQMQLATSSYCKENNLNVNPSKIDEETIETVSGYHFVGIVFKYNNTFGSSLNRHVSSANKYYIDGMK